MVDFQEKGTDCPEESQKHFVVGENFVVAIFLHKDDFVESGILKQLASIIGFKLMKITSLKSELKNNFKCEMIVN